MAGKTYAPLAKELTKVDLTAEDSVEPTRKT